MNEPTPACTLFYDGSCALCSAEIALYRAQDKAGALHLVDVSHSADLPDGLTQDAAMARFHVLTHDGAVLSGAAAFAAVWRQLPGWRWLARLARLPGVLWLLERGYRGFLPLRPYLSRAMARLNTRRRV